MSVKVRELCVKNGARVCISGDQLTIDHGSYTHDSFGGLYIVARCEAAWDGTTLNCDLGELELIIVDRESILHIRGRSDVSSVQSILCENNSTLRFGVDTADIEPDVPVHFSASASIHLRGGSACHFPRKIDLSACPRLLIDQSYCDMRGCTVPHLNATLAGVMSELRNGRYTTSTIRNEGGQLNNVSKRI